MRYYANPCSGCGELHCDGECFAEEPAEDGLTEVRGDPMLASRIAHDIGDYADLIVDRAKRDKAA